MITQFASFCLFHWQKHVVRWVEMLQYLDIVNMLTMSNDYLVLAFVNSRCTQIILTSICFRPFFFTTVFARLDWNEWVIFCHDCWTSSTGWRCPNIAITFWIFTCTWRKYISSWTEAFDIRHRMNNWTQINRQTMLATHILTYFLASCLCCR